MWGVGAKLHGFIISPNGNAGHQEIPLMPSGVSDRQSLYWVVMTSLGLFVASRLAMESAVAFALVMAKLNVPFPVTYDVTSMVIHVPVLTALEVPMALPIAGALL